MQNAKNKKGTGDILRHFGDFSANANILLQSPVINEFGKKQHQSAVASNRLSQLASVS